MTNSLRPAGVNQMSEMDRNRDDTKNEPPDFLTVEEAAVVLRLGRTAAYREARKYIATNGVAGIPVVRYGKQFRVPRFKIEQALGGPISWPLRTREPATPSAVASPAASTPRTRVGRRRSPRTEQTPRLFTA